jgi:hypothetical protein
MELTRENIPKLQEIVTFLKLEGLQTFSRFWTASPSGFCLILKFRLYRNEDECFIEIEISHVILDL